MAKKYPPSCMQPEGVELAQHVELTVLDRVAVLDPGLLDVLGHAPPELLELGLGGADGCGGLPALVHDLVDEVHHVGRIGVVILLGPQLGEEVVERTLVGQVSQFLRVLHGDGPVRVDLVVGLVAVRLLELALEAFDQP